MRWSPVVRSAGDEGWVTLPSAGESPTTKVSEMVYYFRGFAGLLQRILFRGCYFRGYSLEDATSEDTL